MNRIKARLAHTSGSWIATILMVINLVKITGLVRHALNWTSLTFSAWRCQKLSPLQGLGLNVGACCLKISPPAVA
jgi:hypothetical protein